MKGIIYKYTSPSGKVYIGQTRCERTRRSRWFNINKPYDNKMDRNWLAKFVKGKDNHIFRGFMWKEVHDA